MASSAPRLPSGLVSGSSAAGVVGSLALRPHFDSVLIRGPSPTLWLRLTVFCANLFRARPPDSSPESYLLPTRPARRPAPYASDTSPGVTPPSDPRLISVCIQPSPWARRSVGAVEHGGSRFFRPDPPPWRGAGVPARSPRRTSAPRAELPLSIHVRSDPFIYFFYAALVAVALLFLGPVGLPLAQGLDLSGPPSLLLLLWQLSARPSPIVYLTMPPPLSTARSLLNQP